MSNSGLMGWLIDNTSYGLPINYLGASVYCGGGDLAQEGALAQRYYAHAMQNTYGVAKDSNQYYLCTSDKATGKQTMNLSDRATAHLVAREANAVQDRVKFFVVTVVVGGQS